MSSQIFVPGPCSIALGAQTGLTAMEHLGWSMDGVMVNFIPRHEDVMTDLSGPAVPYDVQYHGHDAEISFILAKYNYTAFNRIKALLASGTHGTHVAGDVGSLMRLEGRSMRLLLRPAYVSKLAHNTQQAAYNFPVAFPVGVIQLPLSTRASMPRMAFRAIPNWDETANSAILYNADTTNAPILS